MILISSLYCTTTIDPTGKIELIRVLHAFGITSPMDMSNSSVAGHGRHGPSGVYLIYNKASLMSLCTSTHFFILYLVKFRKNSTCPLFDVSMIITSLVPCSSCCRSFWIYLKIKIILASDTAFLGRSYSANRDLQHARWHSPSMFHEGELPEVI